MKIKISAYSESSNSLEFNPNLQNLFEMICEIIFSKTMCGIFLNFCRSRFINNSVAKNNFLEPSNHQKLNTSRPIYIKRISTHRFEDLTCTNELEVFFFNDM